MTPDQVVALLMLVADLRLQISQQAAENDELRRRLELAIGPVKADDEALADIAATFA